MKNVSYQPDANAERASTLTIKGRLLIGFGTITFIFMVAIGITLYMVNSTKDTTNQLLKTELPLYDAYLDLGGQIREAKFAMMNYLITFDKKYKTNMRLTMDRVTELQQTIDTLQKSALNASIVKIWGEESSNFASLRLLQSRIDGLDVATGKSQIPLLQTELEATTNQLLDKLDGVMDAKGNRSGGIYTIQYQQFTDISQEMLKDMLYVQIALYLISVLGIFSSIIISYLTAKSISRHINVFREYSSKIAARDLRQSLMIEGADEIGQLGRDLNTMTTSLSDITKQITQASQNMVTTLEEVKQAVNVQSSGASEQASSINEITASLEEIEKSSNQTMDKAKALGVVAERTREKGQLGLDAVEQSIVGMKTVRDKVQLIAQTILDLSNQTQQVGEITAVVNGLAQQSKMLALNASIEAAKAGEAGKGFAVVAAEVKSLAEQSEQSTSQVQKILEDIRHAAEKAVMVTEEGTKGVDQGTGLVEQTGEIVRSLSDVIHETTVASQQIEAAVRQESVGIEQITAGMNEINQVTAAFVASAKQTTEAINNLSVIAKNLKEHVDTYKV